MKLFLTALAIMSMCFGYCASAQEAQPADNIDMKKLYVGAGISHNRIDTSSLGGVDGKASGFQIFAGYEYGQRSGIDLSAEAGFIQSDEFYDGSDDDADGVWAAGVATKDLPEINNNLSAIARLGYGLGGDDGLLMGFGAQYRLNQQALLRLEYVNKDLSQSYQLNAVFKF
jgi:opacity protein-like surface antigen